MGTKNTLGINDTLHKTNMILHYAIFLHKYNKKVFILMKNGIYDKEIEKLSFGTFLAHLEVLWTKKVKHCQVLYWYSILLEPFAK